MASEAQEDVPNLDTLEFKDVKTVPDPIHPYGAALRNSSVPIVIDNGSYQCRVGWASQKKPSLIFKNLIAKPRKERSKKDTTEPPQTPQLQVGNDIVNVEAVRFQLKTQFDRNVVTHFEAQEHVFDYIFTHLGIDADKCVPHPVVITEAYLNPNSSRQLMSELLFECYNVPSIAYGVDCLYSYNYSQSVAPKNDSLLVNIGYHTTHIIPILNNKPVFMNSRRINTGGYHIISFLHRLLQLKYPVHTNAITLSRVEELLHSICEVALDYKEELMRWTDTDYYENNIKRIQLPYTATVPTSGLTMEQQKERKKELARRLIEINARKREERLAEDEEKLAELVSLQEQMEEDGEDLGEDTEERLASTGLRNVDDLVRNITALQGRIEKTRQRIAHAANVAANSANAVEEVTVVETANGNSLAKTTKLPFDIGEGDLQTFLTGIKRKRQDILNKRAARKQRRQDMAKRRTAAGQERMRLISQLARKEKGNDDFGSRDEDWDIYKTISREGGDSDSEAEQEKLLEYEDIIRQHEPSACGSGEFGSNGEVNAPGETHQLHVGIERFRAPELLFKPSMIGSMEAGLTEVVGYVLGLFEAEDQLKMASNVILCGGLAQIPGLRQRLANELVSLRPFQSYSNVEVLKGPQDISGLAAWHGARNWASIAQELAGGLFSRKDYDEYGNDYFKQHLASNLYFPSPKSTVVEMEI